MLPTVDLRGQQAVVHNVRNCKYFANDVYMVDYYDKTIDLNRVRGVDYIVVPFEGMPALRHVMLSFQIDGLDGKPEHLAVSVETRKERAEKYNPVKGTINEYELIYVVADERCDPISHRLQRRAGLLVSHHGLARGRPNAIGRRFESREPAGTTTRVLRHAHEQLHVEHREAREPHQAQPHRGGLPRLLPGYSDQLAYDEGLIERHGTFEQTKELAYINPLAQRYAGRDDFSQLIRQR